MTATKTARVTKAQLAAELAQARELISQLQADLARANELNEKLNDMIVERNEDLFVANENASGLRAQISALEQRCEVLSADKVQLIEWLEDAKSQAPSAPVPAPQGEVRRSALAVMKDYAVKHRVITRLIDGVPSFYESRVGQWLTIPA